MTFYPHKDDWQYVLPFIAISIVFLLTDIFVVLEKINLAYISGRLVLEPYRVITAHFVHSNFSHLLANSGGIVVSRFFFKELNLKNRFLFLALTALLIPFQTIFQWVWDIQLTNNSYSVLVGFSGVLYGIDAFVLLSAYYGKKTFLGSKINLCSSYSVYRASLVITILGLLWSFMPGVSFSGHLTGFISGVVLFFLG